MSELSELNAKISDNEEGLFLADISHATYIAHEAISRSELATINEMSPYHYKFKKTSAYKKQTADMLIGSAIHKIFFERSTFKEDYLVAPELNLRKKADKSLLAEIVIEANSNGQEVLSKEQMAKVQAVGDALHAQPAIMKWVKDGVTERSIFRHHNGQILKSRPDYYIPSSNVILDLKSCRDITFTGFLRSVISYDYHVQDAYYTDSVAHFTGEPPRFLFICVEKVPPYQAVIYEMQSSFKMVGRAQYVRALAKIKECEDNDNWPGFSAQPVPMDCPEWLWEGFKKRVRT